MSTLEELQLQDDIMIPEPEEIPEESTGYVPLVQPGDYILRLPEDLTTIWTSFDSKKGPRLNAGFTRDLPLIVVQGDEKYEGMFDRSPVTTFISNLEYPRGRGADAVEVADMRYLILALEANLPDEERSRLRNNQEYHDALVKHAGRMFKATVRWEAYCNPNKDMYVTEKDENENLKAVVSPGNLGCGASYNSYTRDITKKIPQDVNGYFLERFDEIMVPGVEESTQCPAHLFCRIRLSRFGAVVQ